MGLNRWIINGIREDKNLRMPMAKILSLHQLKSPMRGHIVSQSVMRRELLRVL